MHTKSCSVLIVLSIIIIIMLIIYGVTVRNTIKKSKKGKFENNDPKDPHEPKLGFLDEERATDPVLCGKPWDNIDIEKIYD